MFYCCLFNNHTMDYYCYNSSKITTKSLIFILHFSTKCVFSAILLPLTIINTNITMVISKNQLILRDIQIHCDLNFSFFIPNKSINFISWHPISGHVMARMSNPKMWMYNPVYSVSESLKVITWRSFSLFFVIQCFWTLPKDSKDIVGLDILARTGRINGRARLANIN